MQLAIPSLWIISTLSLISFIAFSSQLFILIPLFDAPILLNHHALKLLFPFNLLIFFVFLNYALCLVTQPGNVPKHWDPVAEIELVEQDETKKLLIASLRFCSTCKNYKPPRAHHCRSCNRCVLKMDHHCPWVNNCVGYHNYGHFIRFLISVDLACWYHIYLISKRVFGEFAYGPHPSRTELVMLVLNYVTCLPVILSVGVFTIYHLYSLIHNTTTIEGWEISKASELRRRGRIDHFTFPFNIGPYANLKSVLGTNPFLWWFPQPMSGSGLLFPVRHPLDPLEQFLWPPRDLFTRRLAAGHRGGASHLSGARPHRRLVAPYHGDFSDRSGSGSASDSARLTTGDVSEPDSEDDEPLSVLVERRNRNRNRRSQISAGATIVVRRGSEGIEVRRGNWGVEEWAGDDREGNNGYEVIFSGGDGDGGGGDGGIGVNGYQSEGSDTWH